MAAALWRLCEAWKRRARPWWLAAAAREERLEVQYEEACGGLEGGSALCGAWLEYSCWDRRLCSVVGESRREVAARGCEADGEGAGVPDGDGSEWCHTVAGWCWSDGSGSTWTIPGVPATGSGLPRSMAGHGRQHECRGAAQARVWVVVACKGMLQEVAWRH